jgi:predicted dehydrogenase
MSQVKVGVVGSGRMGQRHCRVYSNMRKVQLVGVYDILAASAEQAARQIDVRAFESLDDLYESVDAVILATPTIEHVPAAINALKAGLHVLVEKPIAATAA